jgi:hypothetical protein
LSSARPHTLVTRMQMHQSHRNLFE